MNDNATTTSAQPIKTKIYDIYAHGLTFSIRYAITGNGSSLHSMGYSDRYIDTQSQSMKYGATMCYRR
jgi:hypothetical protein